MNSTKEFDKVVFNFWNYHGIHRQRSNSFLPVDLYDLYSPRGLLLFRYDTNCNMTLTEEKNCQEDDILIEGFKKWLKSQGVIA